MLKKICTAGVFFSLAVLLVALPGYALTQSPKVEKANLPAAVRSSDVSQPSKTIDIEKPFVVHQSAEVGAETVLEHLSALASFYQTVIAILVFMIGLLATLSFLTIRHVSKTAAEDMAVDAAKRVISDSSSFRDDVTVIVDESVSVAVSELASLKSDVDALTKAIAGIDKKISDLSVPAEELVIINPDQVEK